MNAGKQEMISAELKRVEEASSMAHFAVASHLWNSAADELYYTCYHLVHALFAAQGVQSHTHAGLRSLFSLRFLKEGLMEEKWGKLLAKLFEYR